MKGGFGWLLGRSGQSCNPVKGTPRNGKDAVHGLPGAWLAQHASCQSHPKGNRPFALFSIPSLCPFMAYMWKSLRSGGILPM